MGRREDHPLFLLVDFRSQSRQDIHVACMLVGSVLGILLRSLLVQLSCLLDLGIRVRKPVIVCTLFFLWVGL